MTSPTCRLHLILTALLFIKTTSPNGSGMFFERVSGESALINHVIEQWFDISLLECAMKCKMLLPKCKSFNYVKKTDWYTSICELNNRCERSALEEDFVFDLTSEYFEPFTTNDDLQASCTRGSYNDGLWTLIARFSNSDEKNWMEDQGTWWYDKQEPYGETLDPSANADMISEAFWLKEGSEFRITRSDDPTHTALLTTKGNCLGGKTFRSKITSFGIFRGSQAWASDSCRGNCMVSYGGSYTTTEGFGESTCNGTLQKMNNIGFFCDWDEGDGAVLMIGGGGSNCSRADHGIGITEEDEAKFQDRMYYEYDFGDKADNYRPTNLYSLNMWVR